MKLRAVGVISKPKKEDICAVAPRLLDWLRGRSIRAVCDQETAACLSRGEGTPREQIPGQVDLIVGLGGDGTLLAAARLVGEHNVPLLAVNLGSLGFLTEITLDEMIPVLESVAADQHRLETRRMLEAEVEAPGRPAAHYRALNDLVLHKGAMSRMMDFDVRANQSFVSRMRADGLILSTPTGSTAYSLSAGGPIVLPSVDALVMTPIAPHMLSNRPLVIPGNSVVEIELRAADPAAYVTLDGQVGEELSPGGKVRVRGSEQVIRLVASPSRDYFQVLRSKLRWGEGG